MKRLNALLGNGFKFGRRSVLAAALAVAALGLAAAPAAAATVVVNTTTDQALGSCSSSCSLRDAVATANSGDTVQIPAGNYVLTLGQINIAKDLTLAGAGARTTVIDGNASSSLFQIVGIFNVELDDLSLVNGNGLGGVMSAISFTPPALLTLTFRRCTVANNQSTNQGGALNLQLVDLTIEDSTFSNNHAGPGGGGGAIFSNQARGSIVNSTFSGNTAGTGGAMFLLNGPVATPWSMINNTITANQATSFGGIALIVSQLTLSNNIIAGNVGADCLLISPSLVTDHNLDSDNTCHLTGPGDLPGTNPLLGPLANNGGPTDTYALLGGSPAVNAGNNATCRVTDQRGISRPQGPACDIGAYEDSLVAITVNNAGVTVNEGQTATNGGTVSDADGDAITLTASLGTVVNNGNGTWSWSFPTTDPAPSQTVTITATTDDGAALAASVSFSLVVNDVAPGIASVTNNGPIIVGGSAIITVTAADTTGGNDTLAYEFDCNNDGIFEIGPQAGNTASCTFASVGSFTVNVRVTDGEGGAALGSTVVKVNPPPPNCSGATASPNLLWPPNHKFVAINIGGIVNPAPGAVTISVTSIFQDEPTSGSVDATGVGTGSPSVRSERDGNGDGRVYHINFTATGAGGSCTGSVTVGVPHDQGHNGGPVDEGPLYNSTTP